MKTPEEKYLNDPLYHNFVDTLHSMIEKCELTPSEIREAAVLACIHYERRRIKTADDPYDNNNGNYALYLKRLKNENKEKEKE